MYLIQKGLLSEKSSNINLLKINIQNYIYFQNKQGPPPHPWVPRNGTGRPGGKPPTARGHVKKVKGKKGKKGKKDQYDLIVNIDLVG